MIGRSLFVRVSVVWRTNLEVPPECFFERPSNGVVAGFLDDVQFDDFLFEQAQSPSGVARRRRPTGQRDQFRFRSAVENPGRAEFGLYLRVSTASNPSSTNCRRVRSILATLVSRASAIRLSLQPSPPPDIRLRGCAPSSAIAPTAFPSGSRTQLLALLCAQPHNVFLNGDLFPGRELPHRCFAATEISELAIKINDGCR